MIGAVIQTRMTSSRLPGKVLMSVLGKPLLYYHIRQVKAVKGIDTIVIATTINKEDDPVIEVARAEGVEWFRGSEHDVLERYYLASKQFKLDHLLRLTADCPLLDPMVVQRVLETYLENKDKGIDYVCTGPTFIEGHDAEAFSFQALEIAFHEAVLPSEREHATPYINTHAKFKKIVLTNPTDDGHYRITVDERADYEVVKVIIEETEDGTPFTAERIKAFLDARPDIYNLNCKIVRNSGLAKSLRDDEEFLARQEKQ